MNGYGRPLVNLAVIGDYLRHHDLTQLDSKALILGLCWLGIGIVYLLVLKTRRHC
jgi:putrescine importer